MAVQWDVIEDDSNQDVENFIFFKPVDRARFSVLGREMATNYVI